MNISLVCSRLDCVYSLWYNAPATSMHYTTSCKHSLVLLRMGEMIARNMLRWLWLSIKSVIVASSGPFILLYQWCTVIQTSNHTLVAKCVTNISTTTIQYIYIHIYRREYLIPNYMCDVLQPWTRVLMWLPDLTTFWCEPQYLPNSFNLLR